MNNQNIIQFFNKGISTPRAIFIIVLAAIFCAGVSFYQYWQPSFVFPPLPWQHAEEPVLQTEPVDLSNISTEKISLVKYYSLASLDVALQVSQYDLPLETNKIANFQDFSEKISLSDRALNLLEKNGFAVIKNPFNSKEEHITQPYKTLKQREIPIFITSDSLLHLYHIQFDETLRQIEEREFYDNIWEISKELLNDSIGKYNGASGDLKEVYKRNTAYFAVGLELLKPTTEQLCKGDKWECEGNDAYFTQEELNKYTFEIPDFVKKEVEKELEMIEEHQGFSDSPIFIYKEDYSQYVPRGHYTRSEKLKNYFKAFMWYGRISMLLKGTDQVKAGQSCNDFPPCKAILSLYDAKIQTSQAALIASNFALSKELKDKWDRIYSVTAFYVGLSDDLGPYEYLDAINFVFGDLFMPNDLTEENIGKLKAKLAEYRTPEIYGGTGEAKIWGPPFTPEQADELLGITQGFRLMGQRFIPDSYMFQNLVFPNVDSPLGPEKPFTWVMTDAGPTRGFPRGLDVMALLGSKRARELLDELKDSNYERYDERFNLLKQEFNGFSEADWNKNLYWSWLYTLKSLLKEFGDGYPKFMQTIAWHDKELTTALASWAELRHDTILYAKQSYTPTKMTAIIPPLEKPVVGYIEPVPEFYNKLLALAKMTNQGLSAMEVLDKTAKSRLENLEEVLEKLVELSKKELKNQELEKTDYEFIKNFGERLNAVIVDVDEKAKKTTIIADVHTDQNTKQVLEEGVGYVNLIVVAYKVPDGRILIGVGPVMSYFEFKHPMEDRLTDEKWQEMLNSELPQNPEWISNFSE
jgi:hypothetical protein